MVPAGAVGSDGALRGGAENLVPASLVAHRQMLWCLIIGLSYNVWLKLDAGAARSGVETDLYSVSPCFPRKPD